MRNGKRLVALITAALMLMTGVAAAQDEAPALEPQVYGTFTDVPDDAYYADAVRWAQSVGITNGTTDTTFSPGLTLNRAQGSVFIWRDAGAPTGSPAGGFTDVPAGAYFEEAVNWMVAEGITTGNTATTFSPELPMDRAMYDTFMWRPAG